MQEEEFDAAWMRDERAGVRFSSPFDVDGCVTEYTRNVRTTGTSFYTITRVEYDWEHSGASPGMLRGAGLVSIGLGALLATIWSDVPVARDMRVAPTVGGFSVGSGFGW